MGAVGAGQAEVGADQLFIEITPYSPRSPYSTSKATSDHLMRAYHHTYGAGKNVRDWLYVEDHASAIWAIMTRAGEAYNVRMETERRGDDFVHRLCEIVTDRPGHDQRYAIDCSKLKRDLGWSQTHGFDEGLRQTVRWYLEHRDRVESVRTGDYRK